MGACAGKQNRQQLRKTVILENKKLQSSDQMYDFLNYTKQSGIDQKEDRSKTYMESIGPQLSDPQHQVPLQNTSQIVCNKPIQLKKQQTGVIDEQDINLLDQALNTRSSIMKINKKGKNQKKNDEIKKKDRQNNNKNKNIIQQDENKQMVKQIEKYDQISGCLIDSKLITTFVIQNNYLDMEFMLPKCRAGPLIVPYIEYQKYSIG